MIVDLPRTGLPGDRGSQAMSSDEDAGSSESDERSLTILDVVSRHDDDEIESNL